MKFKRESKIGIEWQLSETHLKMSSANGDHSVHVWTGVFHCLIEYNWFLFLSRWKCHQHILFFSTEQWNDPTSKRMFDSFSFDHSKYLHPCLQCSRTKSGYEHNWCGIGVEWNAPICIRKTWQGCYLYCSMCAHRKVREIDPITLGMYKTEYHINPI